MSSTPQSGGRLLVEPLEARIAPTGLTAIANNTLFAGSTDPFYVTYNTAPGDGHLGFVPASTYLGASAPANVYAIKLTGDGSTDASGLSTGDKLLVYNPTTGFNTNFPFLQAADKTLIAFFKDTNNDGQVQATELVGLSLTKKSVVNVNGTVGGDIVTNLSKDGSTVSLTSVGKPSFNIAGLNINGNVTGDILAGGSINNVTIAGNINNVYAGTSTNGHAFNFTGITGTVTGTIAEGAFKDLKPGASITSFSTTSLTNGATIHAGDGGLGAVGGNITDLAVLQDLNGFNVVAGNGGVGNDTIKGGVGGAVSGVAIVGVAGTTNNALISIHGGNGGENDAFKGGQGGSVSAVGTSFNSFSSASNTGVQSPDLLTQNLLIAGGNGGAGLKGGRGGDVSGSDIFSAAPDDGQVANGAPNAEIQVLGGHGGLPVFNDQGKGGQGGSVTGVLAEDQFLDVSNADGSISPATDTVLVAAGDGGAAQNGGSLSGVSLLGGQVIANAGNGGDGISKGGQGGDLEMISILNLTNLFAHQVALNAGHGGTSSAGSGGAGGEINMVRMLDSDLHDIAANTTTGEGVQLGLVINGGAQANGGTGSKGVGGAGGAVLDVQLNDTDYTGGVATVFVRGGTGGGGTLGGGDGGGIGTATQGFQMFGFNYRYSATGGNGGNAIVLQDGDGGAGGAGGTLDTVGFSNVPGVNPVEVGSSLAALLNINGVSYTGLFGLAKAGDGGTGTTHGGAGGALSGVDLRAGSDATLMAGNGGNGGSAAPGAGGAVSSSAGVSLGGAVSIIAGFAPNVGGEAANGGTITSAIASAQTNITMTAGAGGVGGAGGDILSSGSTPNPVYYDTAFDAVGNLYVQNVSNFGNVTITAGAGSSAYGVAGAGGSVTNFTGSIGLGGSGDFSTFVAHKTTITAGAGGGGDGQTASGAGGSVDQLKLTGNYLSDDFGGQVVTVDGGAAGVANGAKRGGAGGSVTNVTIYNLDVSTVVQHLAAGDGATAFKHGGAGGTINEIHVGSPGDLVGDIGVRDGTTYGYATGAADGTLSTAVGGAGGLFAGVGGTFTATDKPAAKTSVGQNGDVTNVTANAISSIVAGKTSTIHLVNKVDGVNLAGNIVAATNANGSFSNFDTANLVGSVFNGGNGSGAAGANGFKNGDGLVAATLITDNVNFAPEASLTFNSAGLLQFFDLLQSGPNTTTSVNVINVPNIPVTYSL